MIFQLSQLREINSTYFKINIMKSSSPDKVAIQ